MTQAGAGDIRPRSSAELMQELHQKFSDNFAHAAGSVAQVTVFESRAKALWAARSDLEAAAHDVHQKELALHLDEIFGDSLCACYLALTGMHVPARALLRRCLELGVVVIAYWDSPVNFWGWRDHDEDVRFSALFAHIQSIGFKTQCEKLSSAPHNLAIIGKDIEGLYRELSNVVHPKPRNFATRLSDAYSFRPEELADTIELGARVQKALAGVFSARFPLIRFSPI